MHMPLGPTHTVNYKTQDFAEEAKKITQGKGVDLIVDFVGKDHWEKNITSLAMDGRMVMLALLSGRDPKIDLGPLLYKRLRVQGSTLRSRSLEYQAEVIKKMTEGIIPDITGEGGGGPLRTYIHKVYPWTEIQDAHREMQSNKNCGKIIATID